MSGAGPYFITLRNRSFTFPTLADLLAKATPLRSGDQLAGIAARYAFEHIAAQTILADLPLRVFLDHPLIDPAKDEVSQLILDQHNPTDFAPLKDFTVGALREHLLAYETDVNAIAHARGLTPEMVAAVSKICRNQDLILIARKVRIVTRHRNTLGLANSLAVRLQPNHPTDDLHGIAASILDGLLYGAGDACIGINPATDSPANTIALLHMLRELIDRYQIPTQSCVLSHVTTTLAAIQAGAPVDLVFQSVAGTQKTNESFGISLKLLNEAESAISSARGSLPGSRNSFYFETGQGSCLSASAHHGVDQQTLEARAYAVARKYNPLLVNTVVGFIGPEYLYNGKQILRAALEDHFCGKLLGLPMGVDVCYTNHADADQNDMDTILTCLAAAGVNFIMGVPGADDIMLNYQSTSFHDAQYLCQAFGLSPAPEFVAWLNQNTITAKDNRLLPIPPSHRLIQ